MNFKDTSITKRIKAGVAALNAAVISMNTAGGLSKKTEKLIRGVSKDNPDDEEGELISSAQARLLGETFEPVPFTFVEDGQADTRLFTYLARAWSCWATGYVGAARMMLEALDKDEDLIPGGHLHGMTLDSWHEAIKALVAGDLVEARRFYQRSIEAGSQFGTWTNTAIQWTYAASFMHVSSPALDGADCFPE